MPTPSPIRAASSDGVVGIVEHVRDERDHAERGAKPKSAVTIGSPCDDRAERDQQHDDRGRDPDRARLRPTGSGCSRSPARRAPPRGRARGPAPRWRSPARPSWSTAPAPVRRRSPSRTRSAVREIASSAAYGPARGYVRQPLDPASAEAMRSDSPDRYRPDGHGTRSGRRRPTGRGNRCSRSWACCDSVPLSENWLAARVPTPDITPRRCDDHDQPDDQHAAAVLDAPARHTRHEPAFRGHRTRSLRGAAARRSMVSAGRGPVVVPEATLSGPPPVVLAIWALVSTLLRMRVSNSSRVSSLARPSTDAWQRGHDENGGSTQYTAPQAQSAITGRPRSRTTEPAPSARTGVAVRGACPGRNRKNDGVDDT